MPDGAAQRRQKSTTRRARPSHGTRWPAAAAAMANAGYTGPNQLASTRLCSECQTKYSVMVQNIEPISARAADAPEWRFHNAYNPIAPRTNTSGVANAIWVGINSPI